MNSVRLVAALCLSLTACDRQGAAPGDKAPLAGAAIGGPFAMVDQNGRAFTDRDLAGRYRIMYFGYTSCPDVCPADAQAIGAGLKRMEADDPARAKRIVPVFVSVDPARDTPAVLKPFVGAFHPRMVGLTGTTAQVDAIAKAYAVWFERQKPNAEGAYLVNHSRQTYLMDPNGQPLALIPSDKGPAAVAAELGKWVR
ncbi:protein SCO1/2 [Sphingomonas gellani]|uniref:Protein SCO1/2 n=1 Tax=Sphingomonas gellani TaxID=1166340 RepID=A0A1H8HGQ2_9SPHN|nr:SCO family protein [Sphingomonas gellani]SEN55184.1 protein SCO1/2 [Sphingomonas gellani]